MNKEQVKAISKLKTMKVYQIMNQDYIKDEYKCEFDFYWWNVLREVDLAEEGDVEELNCRSIKATKKWLRENQHLSIEYKNYNDYL